MGTKAAKVRVSWGTLYWDNGNRQKDGWTRAGDPPVATVWFETAMSYSPGWHVRLLPSRACLGGRFNTCAEACTAAVKYLTEQATAREKEVSAGEQAH